MILFLDNYDSFTYNLYQYIGELYPDIQVVRNDEITLEEIEAMHPDALLISPGPGYPKDAGISIPAIQKFAGKMPILGICLGHQAIAEAFGGKIVKAEHLMHGKASNIAIDNQSVLFAGLPPVIACGRYHRCHLACVSPHGMKMGRLWHWNIPSSQFMACSSIRNPFCRKTERKS